MPLEIFGEISKRRTANAKAMSAFGVIEATTHDNGHYRSIRTGGAITIFTIGYERRTGEDLITALLDAGIEHLADVRDKPFSRKPDFRAKAIQAFCEEANIEYGSWRELGSTEQQREALKQTGDLGYFRKVFRAYAVKKLNEPLNRLANLATHKSIALMCYERIHEECHRSILADLVADRLSAGVTAIL